MLILYTKKGDTTCEDLKEVFENRRLTYEERDISDQHFKEELSGYGVENVPFMVDPLANFSTGNVEDIIDYASEYAF